ncbi:MAG: calcium/sodium antiporter [Gemmatimonadaceae bacterium]|nr:calcium/sodium antiporter [Gemmatimonadaceae bacterium]
MIAVALVLGGVALLALGAEALVRGATTLARRLRIAPAVVGLTVVALGTSLPELTVGITAALAGRVGIGLGNVVGVNIFNVCVVLGVAALVRPIPIRGMVVRLEWPVMFVSSFACLLLVRDGRLDRIEGTYFIAALVVFTAYAVRIARNDLTAAEEHDLETAVADRAILPGALALLPVLALCGAGIALLVGGGQAMVRGAVAIAQEAGLSERVIGLTIVSMGTGTPEVAASIAAVRRGQGELALGNVIGSNIVNVLGILGSVAVVRPIVVPASVVDVDLRWMLGVTLLLLPLLRRRAMLSRGDGALLLAVYVVYLGALARGAIAA